MAKPDPIFKKYKRRAFTELRPYVLGECMDKIAISIADAQAGAPREGDMIARNLDNPSDQWLVSGLYFRANYEPA